MPNVCKSNMPRSLGSLKEKCIELYLCEHAVLACETAILIKNNGDVHPDQASMFLLHYDLSLIHPFHYLWDELGRIEWGIEQHGYSRAEVLKLEEYMLGMVRNFDKWPLCLDMAKITILRSLSRLN